MSSSGFDVVAISAITWAQRPSSSDGTRRNAVASRSSPASMSVFRVSMSPSVKRTIRLPSGSSTSTDSNEPRPTPISVPAGVSGVVTWPSGETSSGGGCPARAKEHTPVAGSYTA